MATVIDSSAQQVPVNVVGSSKFSIWPKNSLEKTYNMYISDGWMISFPGYEQLGLQSTDGEGRAIFRSIRGNFMIAVIGSGVYLINSSLSAQFIGNLGTSSGEVFIDENLANQICIVDGFRAYIYSYVDAFTIGTLTVQALTVTDTAGNYDAIPGYVSFHNTYFLIGSNSTSSPNPQRWYAFEYNNTTSIKWNSTYSISVKPDFALAVRRLPGRSNNIIVLGSAVAEIWAFSPTTSSAGIALSYQRISSYSIDSGCVSINTIDASDELVAWLSQNENNAPVIMVSNGSETKRISTDGIDHVMESIQHPSQSTAFFFKQNGHLFYVLTFDNPSDNLTLMYDFSSEQFFHLSDENMNYHPARDVVYFNEKSYFISLNDAYLYEIGDNFDTANGKLIPRIRICKTIRREDSSVFRAGMFVFWIEQGVNSFVEGDDCDGTLITELTGERIVTESGDTILSQEGHCFFNNNRPRVDMSISKNGNQSFSNIVSRDMNPMAHFRNKMNWYRLGQANELTIQLRFWGFNRFVVNDGILETY